ncbi:Nnf1-domain-containing protein, partial [Eremomyces bilateralis CBS 781.70]
PPQSRSPSPPAAPPLPSTPGPRAAALQSAFDRALAATLSKLTPTNFAACFPTIAQNRPEMLDTFSRDFSGKLEAVCKAQFEQILQERSVVSSLNALDALLEDAKRRKARAEATAPDGQVEAPIPPHTLPASQLLLTNLSPFLKSQHESLTNELAAVQAQNKDMAAHVGRQREEMADMVAGLERFVADLEEA